jgi:HEAT repeat protein
MQAALSRALEASGRAAVRAAAVDRRAPMRMAALDVLARDPEPQDEQLLLGLLADPLQEIELATVRVLGARRIEAARTELLVRARLGSTSVRGAALQAIGELGGNGVRDALVLGLADPDPVIKLGAARGLARLADPSTTPLLVSLLIRGPESDVFVPAREGLLGLGPKAWPELVRAMNTPGHRARREIALLLAQQGVPDSAPVLMTILTDVPTDGLVAQELAVLTCVEYRGVGNPATSWWDWWEGVVHDDSLAWLCASLARVSERAPKPDDLRGKGTRRGAVALLDLIDDPAQVAKVPHIVERARRELARLLGRELALPEAELREAWRVDVRAAIAAGWNEE